MNLSNPLSRTRFSNGAAKVRINFKLPNFYSKFFIFHHLRQSYNELPAFLLPVFRMGVQRYNFLIILQIFPTYFQDFFMPENLSQDVIH